MLLGDMIGNQQEKQQIDGLAIGRFERNRLGQAHEGAQRRFQGFTALDSAMRHGHAMAQTSRAQAFTAGKAGKPAQLQTFAIMPMAIFNKYKTDQDAEERT